MPFNDPYSALGAGLTQGANLGAQGIAIGQQALQNKQRQRQLLQQEQQQKDLADYRGFQKGFEIYKEANSALANMPPGEARTAYINAVSNSLSKTSPELGMVWKAAGPAQKEIRSKVMGGINNIAKHVDEGDTDAVMLETLKLQAMFPEAGNDIARTVSLKLGKEFDVDAFSRKEEVRQTTQAAVDTRKAQLDIAKEDVKQTNRIALENLKQAGREKLFQGDKYTAAEQIDDTRGFYTVMQRALLDDSGFVKQGMEGEYNAISDQMAEDMQRIDRGEKPLWLKKPEKERAVVRTGTYNGRRVVQYDDGTIEFEDRGDNLVAEE